MTITTVFPVTDNANIQLDDFARRYKAVANSGMHGQMLIKCQSDYGDNVNDSDLCFTKVDDTYLDKNNVTYGTFDAIDAAYTGKTEITFGDIKTEVNNNTYGADVNEFLRDWRDFRLSMGNIELNADGSYPITGNPDKLKSNLIDDGGDYQDHFEDSIQKKHKKVLKKRNDLDNKMRDMYGARGDADLNLDASVYSTMLFTVMTTSLLYYLFIKKRYLK